MTNFFANSDSEESSEEDSLNEEQEENNNEVLSEEGKEDDQELVEDEEEVKQALVSAAERCLHQIDVLCSEAENIFEDKQYSDLLEFLKIICKKTEKFYNVLTENSIPLSYINLVNKLKAFIDSEKTDLKSNKKVNIKNFKNKFKHYFEKFPLGKNYSLNDEETFYVLEKTKLKSEEEEKEKQNKSQVGDEETEFPIEQKLSLDLIKILEKSKKSKNFLVTFRYEIENLKNKNDQIRGFIYIIQNFLNKRVTNSSFINLKTLKETSKFLFLLFEVIEKNLKEKIVESLREESVEIFEMIGLLLRKYVDHMRGIFENLRKGKMNFEYLDKGNWKSREGFDFVNNIEINFEEERIELEKEKSKISLEVFSETERLIFHLCEVYCKYYFSIYFERYFSKENVINNNDVEGKIEKEKGKESGNIKTSNSINLDNSKFLSLEKKFKETICLLMEIFSTTLLDINNKTLELKENENIFKVFSFYKIVNSENPFFDYFNFKQKISSLCSENKRQNYNLIEIMKHYNIMEENVNYEKEEEEIHFHENQCTNKISTFISKFSSELFLLEFLTNTGNSEYFETAISLFNTSVIQEVINVAPPSFQFLYNRILMKFSIWTFENRNLKMSLKYINDLISKRQIYIFRNLKGISEDSKSETNSRFFFIDEVDIDKVVLIYNICCMVLNILGFCKYEEVGKESKFFSMSFENYKKRTSQKFVVENESEKVFRILELLKKYNLNEAIKVLRSLKALEKFEKREEILEFIELKMKEGMVLVLLEKLKKLSDVIDISYLDMILNWENGLAKFILEKRLRRNKNVEFIDTEDGKSFIEFKKGSDKVSRKIYNY